MDWDEDGIPNWEDNDDDNDTIPDDRDDELGPPGILGGEYGPDSNGDGVPDGLDNFPDDPNLWYLDSDNDGIPDPYDFAPNHWNDASNLYNWDSDGDGVSDQQEHNMGYDPNDPNSHPTAQELWMEFWSDYGDWLAGQSGL